MFLSFRAFLVGVRVGVPGTSEECLYANSKHRQGGDQQHVVDCQRLLKKGSWKLVMEKAAEGNAQGHADQCVAFKP